MVKRMAVVVHGGAGAPSTDADGCVRAAHAAIAAMRRGDALDGAVAAVVAMEDDGRFNAGAGSVLGLDGVTVEMDAAIMDTRGRLGAVTCLRRTRNPVLVARAVANTPHWLLAGEGAERFAREAGFAEHAVGNSRAQAAHRRLIAKLRAKLPALPGIDTQFFERQVRDHQAKPEGGDTVGAVTRDAEGHFAVAGSTGGIAPALLGRVGDTPIIGSGFYAGPHGAVAATGVGEQIVRHLLAHTVYGWIAEGMPLHRALTRAIDFFPEEVDVGLIAVSRTEAGSKSNRDMPTDHLEHD
ncbi:isoaspartyl peptidase/L-asparaginase [Noviherbaspirillum pedocola]|uniref:Isoaspartyl peptidase/L-asparaginase n=1 Tax=Noviherbaspirillum pedocola TaxID=2801341 RepID=A0A934SRT1_9BURK|nr:isoaspartyl peptidase/L-asparaginase [Noviherbaspirillum pedocola]MBK4735571.1 isoaspartyl peptidase/L-asparaginase [Noviherbaspirillum pedocola]